MKSSSSNLDIARIFKEIIEDVCEILDDGTEIHVIDYSEDHALNSLWYLSERVSSEFNTRRDAFLWILQWLLSEGRVKLHKNDVYLQGSIEEQVEEFRKAWPATEKIADEIVFPKHSNQIGTKRVDLWFFMDACPAGIAWRQRDGSYQIAE